MAHIISIASGKGGVGKSFVVSNLGALLAKAGRRTILVDMDVGGADLHILFGIFRPKHTLTDFLTNRVKSLEEILIDIPHSAGLQLLAGTGETLATANPTYATKQRLIRHLKLLAADIIIVDIGAGTNLHALDFFIMADTHLIVANPEPSAIIDAYRFIKLAAIRKVLSFFAVRSDVGKGLMKQDFISVDEVLEVAGDGFGDAPALARQAIKQFIPKLILNRANPRNAQVNILQLRKILMQYVGSELEMLGEIPVDANIENAVRAYLPIVQHSPHSPSTRALQKIAGQLIDLT